MARGVTHRLDARPEAAASPATAYEAGPVELSLLAEACAGDGLAFRRLVEPHLALLFRVATRVAGNAELGRDAVQEALALAYQRLGRFRPEASFRAYLTVLAARQAHTLSRAERRRSHREQRARAPVAEPDPEQCLEQARTAGLLREALLALSEKRRVAVLLRLDGALSYAEIASAMGSTEGAARVLVCKGLGQLRGRLDRAGVLQGAERERTDP